MIDDFSGRVRRRGSGIGSFCFRDTSTMSEVPLRVMADLSEFRFRYWRGKGFPHQKERRGKPDMSRGSRRNVNAP
jgi:hypothetical protein